MMSKETHGETVSINKGNTTRAQKMALLPEGQTCFSKFSGRNKFNFLAFLVNCGLLFFALSLTGLSLTGCDWLLDNDDNNDDNGGAHPANTYRGIQVEVTGLPYGYDDICGNYRIDYLIDTQYQSVSTWQVSEFVNFKIKKFIFDFNDDGSLIFKTDYSYDRTPAANGGYYPANTGTHEWNLNPLYHNHAGPDCSLDRYDDIAVSQAKLNEMKKDPSLKRVYDVLLSVAQDMDYDYNQIGIPATFVTPTPLLGTCDDYANLLISRLRDANIPGVSDITKVSSQSHAWVTMRYDGKILYLDATWFDGNNIDKNGVVEHTPRKDPRNMTFDNDIFTNHGYHRIPK